jgi:hypothetical protein
MLEPFSDCAVSNQAVDSEHSVFCFASEWCVWSQLLYPVNQVFVLLKFHFLDHGGIILFYESVVDFFISLKLSLKYLNVSMYNCVQLNSSFFPGLLLRKLLSILLITYPSMPCMIFSRCQYSLLPLIYLELVPFFLLQGLYLITFDIYMFEILKGTYMTYIRDF